MISAQRTLSGMIMVGLLNLTVPMGFADSASLPTSPRGSSVSGTLMSRSSEGSDWTPASLGKDVRSNWFKTGSESEAVIAFAGDVHMRMSPNTVVHVESSSEAGLRVEVPQGNVLTTVPDSGKTPVHMTTPNGVVGSSSGSFIVNVDQKKVGLKVLDGSARLSGERVSSEQLPGVALDSMDAVPGLLAAATNGADDEDKVPDDPNVQDDDDEEGSVFPYFLPLALIPLFTGGGSSDNASGSGTPASP